MGQTFVITDRASRQAVLKAIQECAPFTTVMLRAVKEPPLLDRFLALVEYDLNGGCWFWNGRIGSHGYGYIGVGGRDEGAHRTSYRLFKGPVPKYSSRPGSLIVRHRCDTPCCVNPDHLTLGTQLENMLDRSARGRGRKEGNVGVDHPMATLTEGDVRHIRALRTTGKTYRAIAEAVGTTESNARQVATRKTWGHVN